MKKVLWLFLLMLILVSCSEKKEGCLTEFSEWKDMGEHPSRMEIYVYDNEENKNSVLIEAQELCDEIAGMAVNLHI